MEARPMGRERERLAAASGLLTPRTATATLHEKTETREIRDRWNQLDCGTGERERENRRTYQYQGMERDPNQQQPPELAHGAGARGSRRRGAAMAMESMVERPSEEATANDDESVED